MEFKLKLNASQISDALLHFAHARILTLARIKTHRAKDPACMIEYKTLHIKKAYHCLAPTSTSVRASKCLQFFVMLHSCNRSQSSSPPITALPCSKTVLPRCKRFAIQTMKSSW